MDCFVLNYTLHIPKRFNVVSTCLFYYVLEIFRDVPFRASHKPFSN